jgi:hypothetical protein
MRVLSTGLFMLLVGAAGTVAAQEGVCPPNMVPVGGVCCWPGQGFDPATRTCVGTPQCPPGTFASGGGCAMQGTVTVQGGGPGGQGSVTVQGGANTPPPPPPQAGQPPPGYNYPQPQTQAQPAYAQPQPRTERRIRTGLVVSGALMIGIPWIVVASIATTVDVRDVGILWVPVAGPFIYTATTSGTDDLADPFLVIDGLVQTAGLIMLVLGIVLKQDVPVYAEQEDGRWWSLLPWATGQNGGAGGLSLSGAF